MPVLSFSPKPGVAAATECWCPPSTGQPPNRGDAREGGGERCDGPALLRLTDCLPLRKGSTPKALSLIHRSARSRPRFPPLAPSPRTLLLTCGTRGLCAGALNPQQEKRRRSETSLAFQTRGAQSSAGFTPPLLGGRPNTRPGSSPAEPPAGKDLLCKARLYRAAHDAPVR